MRLKYFNVTYCSLTISALSLIIVLANSWQRQAIVTFDSKQVQKEFVSQLAARNLTDQQITARTLAFKKSLTESLAWYASNSRVLILDKSLVVSGVNDVTAELLPLIAQNMRAK